MIGMNTWCLLGLLGWAIFWSLYPRVRRPAEIEWPEESHLIFSDNADDEVVEYQSTVPYALKIDLPN